jgi:hypothetical protein
MTPPPGFNYTCGWTVEGTNAVATSLIDGDVLTGYEPVGDGCTAVYQYKKTANPLPNCTKLTTPLTAQAGDTLLLYVDMTCPDNPGYSVSCGTQVVKAAPTPTATGKPSFTNPDSTSTAGAKFYYQGSTPVVDVSGITITNNTEAKCGEVSAKATNFTLGQPASGNVGTTLSIQAVATCRGVEKTIGSAVTAKLVAGPKPVYSGTLAWTSTDYSSSTSSYFFLGSIPKVTNTISITNNDVAMCASTEATLEFVGFTEGDEVGKTGTITVNAVATCRNLKTTVATITATVVADPSLSGSCAWNTKNNTFGGGVQASVVTMPTSVNNNYGRCTGPWLSKDGGLSEWDGVVDAWTADPQKMENLAIGADCGIYGITPITCPDITVKDPTQTCEYTPLAADLCNGIAYKDIVTSDVTSDASIGGTAKCFFATTIEKLGNVTALVNGKDIGKCGNTGWGQPTCEAALTSNSVEQLDGGYYIYVGTENWTAQDMRTSNSFAGRPANCADAD